MLNRCLWVPIKAPVMALAMMLLAGCATPTPPLYRWGVYEDLVYQRYKNPGEADPVTAALQLDEDVQRTEAEGRLVPPGVNAYLGYLYFNQGDNGAAREQFEREKALFPESATLMDRLINSLGSK